jgi:glucokinase
MAITLVADIGGTNIRFGLLKRSGISQFKLYPHEPTLTLERAIRRYQGELGIHADSFVVGAAGELEQSGKIHLTNRKFVIDLPKICKTFGFEKGLLTNDMVLHALGIIHLPDTNNACVIYIGTGLGCSYIKNGIVRPSEDGHNRIVNPSSIEKKLKAKIWEDIISGPSFLNIYKQLSGDAKPVLQSREVSYLAHNAQDENAKKTYEIIANCLGKFCHHTIQKEKVSVIYLGGKILEVMRLASAQDIFFNRLGKLSDVTSIRLIKPDMHSAVTGLKLLANDLKKTGTTKRIENGYFYIYQK